MEPISATKSLAYMVKQWQTVATVQQLHCVRLDSDKLNSCTDYFTRAFDG